MRSAAEDLVGPHFKFEELYLYPTLERFFGENYAKREAASFFPGGRRTP